MRSERLIPALAAGTLLLAGCGGSSNGSGISSAPTDSAAAATVAPAADTSDATPVDNGAVSAPAALQFSAPLVGGGELDASSLAGKPTVFWFWAPT